jgi:hypothetical protein
MIGGENKLRARKPLSILGVPLLHRVGGVVNEL